MNVFILASPETTPRLSASVTDAGARVCGLAHDVETASDMLDACSPNLLLAQADIDFPGVTGLVRRLESEGSTLVAFVASEDPMVNDVLCDHDPVGFAPRTGEREAIGELLAKVRAMGAVRTAPARPSRIQGSKRRFELSAGLLALAAVLVGLQLPGLTPSGLHGAPAGYLLVAALGLAAVGCMYSARRPLAAGAQALLVAIVAVLPTG